MIIHFLLDEGECQVAGDRKRISELLHEDRSGADVIQMSVREDHPADIFFLPLEIAYVGNNVVDPRHVLLGPLETHVDDHNILAVLERGHVASDLLVSAKDRNAETMFAGNTAAGRRGCRLRRNGTFAGLAENFSAEVVERTATFFVLLKRRLRTVRRARSVAARARGLRRMLLIYHKRYTGRVNRVRSYL